MSPKKDGSLTKAEENSGYMVGRCAVGKRGHVFFWSCFDCGEGAGLATQGLADHAASEHRCKS